jgi:hypothetical protein
MLDFLTKWPTKIADKVSKSRLNENCWRWAPVFEAVAATDAAEAQTGFVRR